MARGDFLAIAIIVGIMVLAVTGDDEKPRKYVSKCWQCSSNSKGQEFCSDPFDPSKLTEREKALHYIVCMAPPNRETPQPNLLTVCRKIKIIQNDTVVINRNCFWQEIAEPKRACANEKIPGDITVESCELCDDIDGCNHSSRITIQFGQLFALLAIPLAFAHSLSF